jgi:hypothetical protein
MQKNKVQLLNRSKTDAPGAVCPWDLVRATFQAAKASVITFNKRMMQKQVYRMMRKGFCNMMNSEKIRDLRVVDGVVKRGSVERPLART